MLEETLPSLPALFGNPILRGELHEIVSPEPINWLPQTLGWQIVALVLAIQLMHLSWRRLRVWLRNRYRREAQQRLSHLGPSAEASAINEVLKLTAMTAASRREVAALTGVTWCHWLETRAATKIFSQESLQILGEALYNPLAPATQVQRKALVREAHLWINQHRDDHGFY
jgi:hypothetical protein